MRVSGIQQSITIGVLKNTHRKSTHESFQIHGRRLKANPVFTWMLLVNYPGTEYCAEMLTFDMELNILPKY